MHYLHMHNVTFYTQGTQLTTTSKEGLPAIIKVNYMYYQCFKCVQFFAVTVYR